MSKNNKSIIGITLPSTCRDIIVILFYELLILIKETIYDFSHSQTKSAAWRFWGYVFTLWKKSKSQGMTKWPYPLIYGCFIPYVLLDFTKCFGLSNNASYRIHHQIYKIEN